MDHKAAATEIRDFATALLTKALGEEPPRQVVIGLLSLAWSDAVCNDWECVANADPNLSAALAVAKELMKQDGYEIHHNAVCMLPGAKAMVCRVDGKEAVCLNYSMGNPIPLTAIYTDRVSEAVEIAEKVLAAKAAAEPAKPETQPSLDCQG